NYLVIPFEQVATVNDLKRDIDDHQLVSHMLNVGKNLLSRDAPESKLCRFGFHQPPFNSVDHLHLHCFALPYIPRWKHMKYVSLGSIGFIEAEKLLERIKPLEPIGS
ncbi:Sulfate adenylyltransferase (ADP) protein, partial [Dioscorea alata]